MHNIKLENFRRKYRRKSTWAYVWRSFRYNGKYIIYKKKQLISWIVSKTFTLAKTPRVRRKALTWFRRGPLLPAWQVAHASSPGLLSWASHPPALLALTETSKLQVQRPLLRVASQLSFSFISLILLSGPWANASSRLISSIKPLWRGRNVSHWLWYPDI